MSFRSALALRTAARTTTARGCATRALSTSLLTTPSRSAATARPSAMTASFVPARPISSTSVTRKEQRDAWAQDPVIGYEEVKKISEQPSDKVLLIDVREPDEVALGTIPSSVNLPLSQLDNALSMNFNPGTFQKDFAFAKPQYSQNMVFFCRSGKRSATACEIANRHGYPNTRNFAGSWLEWCEKEGIPTGDK